MKDDDFPSVGSGPSILDDDDDPHDFAKRGAALSAAGFVFGVLLTGVGFAVGAYIAWTIAPPVGGEWWPYIRAVVAFVGGVVGAKLGTWVAFIIGFIVIVAKGAVSSLWGGRR